MCILAGYSQPASYLAIWLSNMEGHGLSLCSCQGLTWQPWSQQQLVVRICTICSDDRRSSHQSPCPSSSRRTC
jgi:hypothetical protein